MILDQLQNWKIYFPHASLPEQSLISKAFGFLQDHFHPSMADGRIDLDNDRLFAVIATYETRPIENCRFEVHRRYLDIQYIVSGGEAIGWTTPNQLKVAEPYDSEKDVEFFRQPEQYSSLHLYPGHFAVFGPDDAHAPGIRLGNFIKARKILLKVALENTMLAGETSGTP